jgi:hypothetical protein
MSARTGLIEGALAEHAFLLPPPLWGRAGERGSRTRCGSWLTPLPNPPPQGGREQQYPAAGVFGRATRETRHT